LYTNLYPDSPSSDDSRINLYDTSIWSGVFTFPTKNNFPYNLLLYVFKADLFLSAFTGSTNYSVILRFPIKYPVLNISSLLFMSFVSIISFPLPYLFN